MKKIIYQLPLLLALSLLNWQVCAARYYVNAAATGTNAGTDWANAYTNLKTTMDSANSGDEIWVAKGLYKPSTNDRTLSFNLKPGVKVYGHFAGTETTLAQRNFSNAANRSILSGDIDNNDSNTDGNNISELASQIVGSNSYHVVVANGTGTIIDSNTVLDGFTITGGQANTSGGGLYCYGSGTGKKCSPVLSQLSFSGNSASNQGGAISNQGYQGTSSPSFSNVSFAGNSAVLGGAIYNDGYQGTSSPSFSNVSFAGNSAVLGGAIFNTGYYGGTSSPSFKNSILWANTASSGGAAIFNDTASSSFGNSILQNGGCNASCSGSPSTADPLFVSTTNLQLQAGSPAIDAGDNSFIPAGVTTDLAGNPRISGSAVDMGAYESNYKTLTLNKTGNNGTVASTPTGIDCGTICQTVFAANTAVTLTATPAAGYIPVWGGACSGTANTCAVTLSGDKTVSVKFVLGKAVTVSVSGEGRVAGLYINCGFTGTSCTANYYSGISVTFSVLAKKGSRFKNWSGDCTSSGTASTCTLTMDAAKTATAIFEAIPSYALTVSTIGSGSVTGLYLNCGSTGTTCSANYIDGTAVVLTAKPNTGQTFTGWSGGCSGTANICTVTMNAVQNVTAQFGSPAP